MVTVANREEPFNLVNERILPPQEAKGVTGPLSLVSIRTQHCLRRGKAFRVLTTSIAGAPAAYASGTQLNRPPPYHQEISG